MKKNNLMIIAIVAIVALAGMTFYAVSRSDNNTMMDNSEMSEMMEDVQPMADMNSSTYKEYAALKGEDYDRLFLANMIEHHQGAVSMAKLALTSAKHQELKDVAQAVIDAQGIEISDMTLWQKQWGYPTSSGEIMMDHSAMGMMEDMSQTTASLGELSGDAFDKKFIELMIEHHQHAVDMAASGKTNAYHAELISLTQEIVVTQSKEITKMKQWQKDWGYVN